MRRSGRDTVGKSRARALAIVSGLGLILLAAPATAAPGEAASEAGPAPGGSSPSVAACPSAAGTAGAIRQGVCLMNRERASRGLRPLRANAKLATAAERHAWDMVRRGYFAHRSPSGTDLVDRIRVTGYFRAATRWKVGENLAWGTGELASAVAVSERWMASPPHRANVLSPRFQEVGLAAVPGTPKLDGGLTYVAEFGLRD